MRRSPSYNNLEGENGVEYEYARPRAGRNDSRLDPNIQESLPGQWPASPPSRQRVTSPRPRPISWSGPPNQAVPPQKPRYEPPPPQAEDDFLAMPEPVVPAWQDSTLFRWAPAEERRSSGQYRPGYEPLDDFANTLSGALPPSTAPPPLPPKNPVSSSRPPQLPPRRNSPHQDPYYVQSIPDYVNQPSHVPSQPGRPVQDIDYFTVPDRRRQSSGPHLSPDYAYTAGTPQTVPYEYERPSSAYDPRRHSGGQYYQPEPRPQRYEPRPPLPGSYDPYPEQYRPQYQNPPPESYRPTPSSYYTHPPGSKVPAQPERYSPKPPPPQVYQEPYQPQRYQQTPPPQRRPSPQLQPQHPPPSDDARRRSSPRPLWNPIPPPELPPAGPVTHNPPPTSLADLKHLPVVPILTPPYHKETLDHPQHFAKNSNLRIIIVPAESTTFVAGGEIYGRMELLCKLEPKAKADLLIGEIGIELIAYDESRSEQGQAAPRSHLWLLSRRVFQAPFDKSADLDKVSSAIAFPVTFTPDDKGYRQPAKANTTFPFRFLVPLDAASAVECGQEVRTRYTLTGYAKVRISGSFETIAHSLEVDVVEQLPYDHIYRSPYYKHEALTAKDTTDKNFRGKCLMVEASIPQKWYKTGDTIPVTITLTPTGFKKVGWIKVNLINRVTIKTKTGQGKEVALDYGVAEDKTEEDTDFDPEKPNVTLTLRLKIPHTCRTSVTGLFEVRQYIKVSVLHNTLSLPFSVSLPSFDIFHPDSFEPVGDDGEIFAGLVTTGSYIVREIDIRGDAGKVITERPGTNRPVLWDWYVDRGGRKNILNLWNLKTP